MRPRSSHCRYLYPCNKVNPEALLVDLVGLRQDRVAGVQEVLYAFDRNRGLLLRSRSRASSPHRTSEDWRNRGGWWGYGGFAAGQCAGKRRSRAGPILAQTGSHAQYGPG